MEFQNMNNVFIFYLCIEKYVYSTNTFFSRTIHQNSFKSIICNICPFKTLYFFFRGVVHCQNIKLREYRFTGRYFDIFKNTP